MPRDISPAFRLEDLGWIDFETANRKVDLKQAGAYRYVEDADAIICTYAIGLGPVFAFTGRRAGGIIQWSDVPADFSKHYYRVVSGEAKWAAWNAAFDRCVWNYATLSFPELGVHHIIDVMVQAVAAGLPPDLAMAARQSKSTLKIADGKKLIQLFCRPTSTATPESHPAEWKQLIEYAIGDIEAMRAVFRCTRQLALAEWQEYWAAEVINARGVGVDVKMAGQAAALARLDRSRSSAELARLTNGKVTTVGQVANIVDWLLDGLPDEGVKILTKREVEEDDNGEMIRPAKYSLTRGRVEKLIAFCQNAEDCEVEEKVLQTRLYGGSTTPAKFQKILDQNLGGVLYGQYVFNGAAQTGRASSRGVQIHNLSRSTLDYEHEAIEALLTGCDYDTLAALGDDTPVSRKLSLLIRPTFVPHETNHFVWSDWSQIEARILPWLADAEARLDIFREVDRDHNLPDLYVRTAADISGLPTNMIDEALRQRGKVAELALGFGGGVGALQSMAAALGMYLSDDDAKDIVTAWRRANPWCVAFWGRHESVLVKVEGQRDLEEQTVSTGLWGAANRALLSPGSEQWVGKLCYVYLPLYLGGSLVCMLPSGRLLTYRDIRYENVEDLDDEGTGTGKFSIHLRYSKGYGRAKMWHGTLCENVVQAVAADCLRGTLVRLVGEGFDVRLHTHDEILVEVENGKQNMTALKLREVMQRGFEWSEGLPLMSEETISPYYTKWKLKKKKPEQVG